MDPDRFNVRWKSFILVNLRNQQIPLTEFLGQSLGRHRGGVLFIGRGTEDGNNVILKTDEEDNCYRKVSDTDDDERDWELIGYLVDKNTGPDLPPYT